MCAKASFRKEISDHYNGKTFFNPTLPHDHTFKLSSLFKLFRHKGSRWPEKVDNTATPQLDHVLTGSDIAVTFINHVTFLIQFAGMTILTDPVWSERTSPFSWIGPKRCRPAGLPLEKLPPVDLILISHNHYDHLDVQTLKRLSQTHNCHVIVAFGDKDLVQGTGFQKVTDWTGGKVSALEQIQKSPLHPHSTFLHALSLIGTKAFGGDT